MQRNVSGQKIALFAFDYSTGAPKTGDAANLTAYVSKDGGSVTVLTDTTATEMDATNAKGWYSFDVSQTESNGDELLFSGKSSTANVSVVARMLSTVPASFTSFVTPTGASVNLDTIKTQTVTAAAGVTFPSSIASPTNITAASGVVLSSAGVQAIWDALTSALTTVGSIGKLVVDNLNATVSSRLASASYTAPLDAAGTRSAVGLASANLDTQLTAIDDYLDTEVAAIKAKTDQLVFTTANRVDATAITVSDKTGYSLATGGVISGAIASAELNAIADALLDRNMATGTDSGADNTTTRTVRQALRRLRNKEAIAAGTGTVYKENDSTASWTYAATTTAGDPLSSVDPT